MLLESGEIIAERFRIVRKLGEGGMGVVFLVHHLHLKRDFALKLITRTHPEVVRRAQFEASTQAGFTHPNIVGLTDFMIFGGYPCMIMEYVDGEPLHQWIWRQHATLAGPNIAHVERIFAGILAGMEVAHGRSLVHRDLKPGNVILARDGTAKVADFGLVKVLGDTAQQHTRDGTVVGTAGYMAPEQTRDAKNVDARTDVFALGCILYELVTGQRLYAVASLDSAIAAHDAGAPALRVSLPEHLEPVVLACIEPDRRRRPADARAVRELLGWPAGPVIGGVPVETHEGTSSVTQTFPPDNGTRIPAAPTTPPSTRTVEVAGLGGALRTTSGVAVVTSVTCLLALGVGVEAWRHTTAADPRPPTPIRPAEAPLVGWEAAPGLVYGLTEAEAPPEEGLAVRVGVARRPWSAAPSAVGTDLVAAYAVDWLGAVDLEAEAAPAEVLALVGPLEGQPARFLCGLDGLPACAPPPVGHGGNGGGKGDGWPPLPPPPPGSLTLVSTPYAAIEIDGRSSGKKTHATLELPSGRHHVRLVTMDGRTRDVDVTVPAASGARYCWNFEDENPC